VRDIAAGKRRHKQREEGLDLASCVPLAALCQNQVVLHCCPRSLLLAGRPTQITPAQRHRKGKPKTTSKNEMNKSNEIEIPEGTKREGPLFS
jgi:hypothetical protein